MTKKTVVRTQFCVNKVTSYLGPWLRAGSNVESLLAEVSLEITNIECHLRSIGSATNATTAGQSSKGKAKLTLLGRQGEMIIDNPRHTVEGSINKWSHLLTPTAISHQAPIFSQTAEQQLEEGTGNKDIFRFSSTEKARLHGRHMPSRKTGPSTSLPESSKFREAIEKVKRVSPTLLHSPYPVYKEKESLTQRSHHSFLLC